MVGAEEIDVVFAKEDCTGELELGIFSRKVIVFPLPDWPAEVGRKRDITTQSEKEQKVAIESTRRMNDIDLMQRQATARKETCRKRMEPE